jgi:hypothetical protein
LPPINQFKIIFKRETNRRKYKDKPEIMLGRKTIFSGRSKKGGSVRRELIEDITAIASELEVIFETRVV